MRRLVMMAAAIAAVVTPAAAQSPDDIARRVAAAPDGSVQMTFAARPDVCGDGRDVIRSGQTITVYPSMIGRGRSDSPCDMGPLRVVLTTQGGEIVGIRTHVGRARARTPASPLTDLGTVSAPAAARYLLSLASRLDGKAGRDAILPASLADSITVWRDLIALARNSNRPRETRRSAMMWIGMSADASAAPALDSIAHGDVDERSMREAALTALSSLEDGAGVPALTRLARGTQESWLRKQATFWLGNAEDPRARTAIRDLAASDTVAEEIRKQAIFALGHLQRSDGDDEFLRSLYPRLTNHRLKDQLIQSMGQSEQETGKRWLLGIVVNADEPMQMRKQALFWAGQNQWLPVKDLVAIYPKLTEMPLKEHFVFVLSQRKEDAATTKMIDIAKSDPDRGTRKKALFWLGQMDDPKVAKFLQEAIEK